MLESYNRRKERYKSSNNFATKELSDTDKEFFVEKGLLILME